MKRILSILFLLFAVRVMATNYNAATSALSDVQAAVYLAVNNGDSVTVPAGSNFWTSALVITNDIQLIGNGTNKTIILDGQASYLVNPRLIDWTMNTNGFPRLTGFTFVGLTNTAANADGGANSAANYINMQLRGQCGAFRMDSCVFTNLFDIVIKPNNQIYGVIDHCWFNNETNQGNVIQDDFGGPSDPYGDTAWASPDAYGTTNALYVEDCDFENTQQNHLAYADDMLYGSSMVFRHCIFNTFVVQVHGTEGGQRNRGGRLMEFYLNTVKVNAQYLAGNGNMRFMSSQRSGTGVMWSNTFYNIQQGQGGFDTPVYRLTDIFPPFYQAQGTNQWDTNNPTLIDSGTATSGSGAWTLNDTSKSWTASMFVGGSGNQYGLRLCGSGHHS